MKAACVIGWPISHSRSPLIHNYWLKQHGIAGNYGIVPVQPQDLAGFISTLQDAGYCGCNVTIPHKEAVFTLVTSRDERASRVGAANTLYVSAGRLHATNTDGEGFIANVKATAPKIVLSNARVAILGAGGSAMAIIGALLDEGVAEIAVFNRTVEKADAMRDRFGKSVVPHNWEDRNSHIAETSLLINATALGMTGQPSLDIDLKLFPRDAAVADIVYLPLVTPLLKQAALRGNVTIPGLGMLLHQAVRGFELWFGVKPAVTKELYDLVARDVDAEYAP